MQQEQKKGRSRFHRGQRVRHPHHGEAEFIGYVIDSETECTIGVGSGESRSVETVETSNLEVIPWLGPSWLFEMPTRRFSGSHVEVKVRVGTIGSRALAGTLTLQANEAEDFAIAVKSLGAEVSRARPGKDLSTLTPTERDVNTILHTVWDPIGCGVPEDEYESYVRPVIARALAAADRDKAIEEVTSYLSHTRGTKMMLGGIAARDSEIKAAIAIADRVRT